MRYLGPVAVLFMSLLIAADPTISVGSVLAFLGGLLLTFLPASLAQSALKQAGLGFFYLLPVFFPAFLPYVAPAVFWHGHDRQNHLIFACLVPPLVAGLMTDEKTSLLTVALCLLAFLLGRVTRSFAEATRTALGEMDKERAKRLEAEAEKEARARQADQSVRLATLAERNRIARDLHDTIGHVLSSALLQTTALLTVNDHTEKNAGIRDLQSTLRAGMEETRRSVHGLYQASLSFEREVKDITDNFTFCPIQLSLHFHKDPPSAYSQTMLKAIREALTNVARHSNAGAVSIQAEEHPGFYRLKIKDNGSRISEEKDKAGVHLGLDTMARRAGELGGIVRTEEKGGYGLIVVLPKPSENKLSIASVESAGWNEDRPDGEIQLDSNRQA